jgi:hypothetical protein
MRVIYARYETTAECFQMRLRDFQNEKFRFPGGAKVGSPQEQAEDELREAVAGTEILLRQEHHSQNFRKEVICYRGLF